MKKTAVLTLAFIMILSLTLTAFAANCKCGYCGSVFETEAALAAHIDRYHSGEGNICPYCNQRFGDEDAYNDHIKICYSQRANGTDEDNQGFNWGLFDKLIGLDLAGLFDGGIDIYAVDANIMGSLTDIFLRIVDFIENMIYLGA